MTYFLAGAIGSIIGFIVAALLSNTSQDDYDYLNHDQNDEFTEQL